MGHIARPVPVAHALSLSLNQINNTQTAGIDTDIGQLARDKYC